MTERRTADDAERGAAGRSGRDGIGISRRTFIASAGAIVVSFSLRPLAQDAPAPRAPAGPSMPSGSFRKSPLLESWIRIGADGSVTVFTGKAELGQGIVTALRQIAAEQLAVPLASIAMTTADTAQSPDEGYTAGSNSIKDSGTAIMHAAAQARELLVAEAARRWSVAPDTLIPRDGAIVAADGRKIPYGELVAGMSLHVDAQPVSKLIDPAQYRVVGKPVERVDIPRKVTGGASYVHDLRLPGMLHARVIRPPSVAATLESIDVDRVSKLAGVVKVVRDGRYLAVICNDEYRAIQAMRALSDSAKWSVPRALPARDAIHARLLELPAREVVIHESGSAAASDGRTLEATFRRPYQIHGSIGPSCAVAELKDGTLTIHSHTQGVYPLRDAIAELVAMPKEKVHVIHREGAGCYGHNGADDAAADAALLALVVPGRPVRVQWMREQEHAWEPYGPAMIMKTRATLSGDARVSGWRYDVWSNTHSTRPGKAGNLLPAWLLSRPFAPPPPQPIPQPEGGGDRNAIPLYAFPGSRVVHHFIDEMPLRVSALRGLGAYANVFAIESFVDELALAAKVDPVELRLKHLEPIGDPRAGDVIRMAAERFGWTAWRKSRNRGRGFAFARYKNLAAYLAIAMDVDVDRETGDVRVGRVVAAIDSGQAVNPDGIRHQTEGGIVQSLSWSLFEAVTWDASTITSRDWARYPVVRFDHVPKSIEVHVIDRRGAPFLGTGEAAQGPTAAALANAIGDALGVRLRDLPLNGVAIRAALDTAGRSPRG